MLLQVLEENLILLIDLYYALTNDTEFLCLSFVLLFLHSEKRVRKHPKLYKTIAKKYN